MHFIVGSLCVFCSACKRRLSLNIFGETLATAMTVPGQHCTHLQGELSPCCLRNGGCHKLSGICTTPQLYVRQCPSRMCIENCRPESFSGNGNLLATSSNLVRVTRIMNNAEGRVQASDPSNGNYGESALPEYMFERVCFYRVDLHNACSMCCVSLMT